MITAALPAEEVVKLVLVTEAGMLVGTIVCFVFIRRWWRNSKLRELWLNLNYDPDKEGGQ